MRSKLKRKERFTHIRREEIFWEILKWNIQSSILHAPLPFSHNWRWAALTCALKVRRRCCCLLHRQTREYEYVSRSSGDFLISASLSSLHFSVNGFPHLFNMLWQCARFWWWNVKFGIYNPTFQQQHTMTTSLCNMCWAQTESSASEQSDFARLQ